MIDLENYILCETVEKLHDLNVFFSYTVSTLHMLWPFGMFHFIDPGLIL